MLTRFAGLELVVALSVGAATLGLYTWTAAPDIPLVDSGELALAAANGGVAHPPGVPLYGLVGRLFVNLPVATPVRALNLMSAVFGALAVISVFGIVERSLVIAGATRRARMGGAVVGAVAFATAYNPWTWSAVTEVYTLNVFLGASAWACAMFAAVVIADGRKLPARGEIPVRAWRWLTGAAAFASLGLANHHATALLIFPGLGAVLLAVAPRLLRSPRFWVLMVSCGVGSLALYGTLLLAARSDSGLGWGGVESVPLLWRHVTGAQYSEQVGSVSGETQRVAAEFARTLVLGAGIPTAILAALGTFLGLTRLRGGRGRAVVVATPLVLVALNLALSINYVAGPEDRMAYDLPATIAWCVLAGIGAAFVLVRSVALPTIALIAVVGGWNGVRNASLCNLRGENTARMFCDDVLAGVPDSAVVLTAEWNFYAPFLYRRHLEGYRPGVRVIDVLMLRRFWYFDYLERTMPNLVGESRAEFDAFRREVTNFDLGRPYDAAAIQSLYDGLMRRWIEVGIEEGGAFVEWSCLERPQEVSWVRGLPLVPDGLLLRVAVDSMPNTPLEPKDPEHVAWVRSKITEAAMRGDLSDLVPRHDPYRKVWTTYQNAVDASLIAALRDDGEASMLARARAYESWYPEIDRAVESARLRVGLP